MLCTYVDSMPPAKKPNQFDLAALQKMAEPIVIRVVRVDRASGNKMPITLPQTSWSKEDAAAIEQHILNDIAGGGTYEAEMTGARGTSFTWKFAFPEQFFPPKIPAAQMAAASAPQNGGMPPGVAAPGTAWNFGPTPQYMYPPQQPPPQPYQPGVASTPRMPMAYPFQQQQPFYNPYLQQPQQPATSKEDGLRREVEQMRQATQASEHRREREAAESRHVAELAEMRRAIEGQKQQSPDAQMEMMKLQMQQQEQERERERTRRDQDREREQAGQRLRDEESRRRWEEETRRRDEQTKQQTAAQTARRDEDKRRDEERFRREEERRREERTAREAESRRWEMTFQMMTQQFSNNPMSNMLAETTRELAQSQRDAAARAAEAPVKSGRWRSSRKV